MWLYGLASLLVPGLGQFLSGRRSRGALVLTLIALMLGLIGWAVIPSVGFTEATLPFKGDPANYQWLIAVALVWLWGVWDAAAPATPRPLWVPFLISGFMFYSLGWQASGLNPRALTENFDRAMQVLRPMSQPDFIQPRAERREGWAQLIVPCPAEGEAPAAASHTVATVTLTLSAGCAQVGETLTAAGAGLWTDTPIELVWQSPIGDFFPLRVPETQTFYQVAPDAQGNFTASFVVPNAIPPGIDPTLAQEQRLYVRQSRPLGGYELSTNGGFVVQGIYETVALALMATTFGAVFAIPLSFLAARNLMSANPLTLGLYVIVRTLLNIVRSIESLIIAVVFVVFVGLGPFAGMLALMVHTIAALAKLYSEVIEGIDPGPIEAIRATGANWLQVARYAVVPQIVPPFTAFTIYRWDINVRSSTIVGLVGGGGIGFFLVQWINLSDFRAVSASFIAILVGVMLMDFFSARIREKLN